MLSNYRVLDLTDERGHFAGQLLAALGAEVIAVEPPGGMRARQLGPFVGDRPDPEGSLSHFAANRGKRSVVLDLTDAAKEHIAREGYDPVYGARPLKRAIQQRIENPLSKLILQGKFGPKDVIPVQVDAAGEFQFGRTVH